MNDLSPPIVIVDDEPRLAKMLEHLVKRVGVPARIFTDANEALAFVRAHPVAAIMADQLMPAMTGAELLERAPEAIPGYLMTGDHNLAAELSGHPRVTRVLSKPVPPAELIALLKSLGGA